MTIFANTMAEKWHSVWKVVSSHSGLKSEKHCAQVYISQVKLLSSWEDEKHFSFLSQCLAGNWKLQTRNLLYTALLPAVTLAKIVCFIVLLMCSYPNYIVAEIKMKFFFLQCSTSKVWKAFKIPQSFKSADFAKSCKYIQWISSIGPDCL